MRRVALGLVLAAAGCAATLQPPRPTGGYALTVDGRRVEVRVASGNKSRRFQGAIQASRGRLLGVIVLRPELRDRVALDGESIQFDLEPSAGAIDGFDFSVAGCAKLELLIDGKTRPRMVRSRGASVEFREGGFTVCSKEGS